MCILDQNSTPKPAKIGIYHISIEKLEQLTELPKEPAEKRSTTVDLEIVVMESGCCAAKTEKKWREEEEGDAYQLSVYFPSF